MVHESDVGQIMEMNTNAKKVSVIIPTFNRCAFIGAAMESVLAQDYQNLEVLVVDDGSTDDTAFILAAVEDSRLRYVRQDNRGRSHARNVALELATGSYIAFLDSDDLYLPGKLTLQVNYLESHPSVGMVYTSATCIDEAGQPLEYTYRAEASGDVYAQVAFFQPLTITLPTVMIRREVLALVGLFDERMERFEDTDLWRRIAKRYQVGAITEPTCKLRTHSDNELLSQDPTKILAAIDYYVEKVNREDGDIDPVVRGAGARRLYEYYAAAMRTVPAYAGFADLFSNRAQRCFNPKVSIIMPVYNAARYLREAIDSALAQTYENTEIVVVNDGSSDDGATARIARGFGERIRYFEKSNGGVATALNRGVEEMTGDYFSWLSHDDLYATDKVAIQVTALWHYPDPRKVILYGDYAVFTQNPREATPMALPHVEPEDFRRFITTENVLHGCTLLVPRLAFEEHGGFDPGLHTTQDYDLWFRMASTMRFVHQPVILVKARSHAEQGTLRLSELVLKECNALLAGFVEQLSPSEVCTGDARSLAGGYFQLAANLERRGFVEASERADELGRAHLAGSEELLSTAPTECNALVAEIRGLRAQIERLYHEREGLRASEGEKRAMVDAIYHSTSWRVTAPLRYVRELIERFRG
jgi:glycosyltransferase involved in cell wall biosynthesis